MPEPLCDNCNARTVDCGGHYRCFKCGNSMTVADVQIREAALYAAIEDVITEALYDAGIHTDDPMDEIMLAPPHGFSGGRV